MDTCRVAVQFTKLFVDSATGDDDTATGCINIPYRTITAALGDATSGMTVIVRPGTYSDAAGEVYPFVVNGDITLEGEDWETCIIKKETQASENVPGVTVTGTLRKLSFKDLGDHGVTRWRYTIETGSPGALLDSVRISEHARRACIRIDGDVGAVVQNCVINVEADMDEGNIYGRGMEIIFDDVGTIVRGCRISGFGAALFFNYSSDALVENCHLINNNFGVEICCSDDENSNPIPDFGGGARGSAGGNNIWGNTVCGLVNSGTSTIYAKYNNWDFDPPQEGHDFCNESMGEIILE
jgi:hypothetical protein